jgi:hypothetical protein
VRMNLLGEIFLAFLHRQIGHRIINTMNDASTELRPQNAGPRSTSADNRGTSAAGYAVQAGLRLHCRSERHLGRSKVVWLSWAWAKVGT